jgi:hypothetical protein
MESLGAQQNSNNENLDRTRALEKLQMRNKELLKTTDVQIKLSRIFFPEKGNASDQMMYWSEGPENYASKFREILDSRPDLKKKIMEDDDSVLDDFLNLLTH